MKYLPLYRKWMKNGKLPYDGLCRSLEDTETIKSFFQPSTEDRHDIYDYNWYWAHGEIYDNWDNLSTRKRSKFEYEFSPLRQNIVLLLAALNNEL